ncbi:MAG TPA: hypothetical protein VN380_11240 [Thermoanaerobaculia bacterium]|jgi:hypothetical protein|nr:hypothetical protein [Thermoanaerobaculia bacterium]
MSDETRILRTVGIPIVIAVILLVVMPKMCAKVVLVSKARQEAAARAAGGLHIESSQKPVLYPAGLDPERVRYLVEIDPTFSAPYTAHINKSGGIGAAFLEQQRIIPLLQKLGYAEAGSDGTLTLTRDGMLHLDGLVDDGSSWTFPIATREFDAVTSIDSEGANAHAGIAWKWKPNTVGAELIPSPQRHEAKAELASVGGRWSLTAIGELDRTLE